MDSRAILFRQAAYLALMRYPGGLQLGGGVTNENAARYLEAGASHVIVTSYVFRDGHLDDTRLQRLVRTNYVSSDSTAFLPARLQGIQ